MTRLPLVAEKNGKNDDTQTTIRTANVPLQSVTNAVNSEHSPELQKQRQTTQKRNLNDAPNTRVTHAEAHTRTGASKPHAGGGGENDPPPPTWRITLRTNVRHGDTSYLYTGHSPVAVG